ncbi:MAG: peptidylprolyl isomerase [Candidatus Methylomirabilales bacterium]
MTRHGMNCWIAFGAILYACIAPVSAQAEPEKGEKEMTVSAGTQVSIEYTLRLEDKNVLDTNVGSDPLTYVHGSQQIIPGLEKALEGMKIGDSKQVTIKPENAYGVVNEEAIVEVKKEELPQDALKEGAQLQGRDANGRTIYARVVEVKEQTVVVDFNHPLAGRTLYFDVKILDIQKASAE